MCPCGASRTLTRWGAKDGRVSFTTFPGDSYKRPGHADKAKAFPMTDCLADIRLTSPLRNGMEDWHRVCINHSQTRPRMWKRRSDACGRRAVYPTGSSGSPRCPRMRDLSAEVPPPSRSSTDLSSSAAEGLGIASPHPNSPYGTSPKPLRRPPVTPTGGLPFPLFRRFFRWHLPPGQPQ